MNIWTRGAWCALFAASTFQYGLATAASAAAVKEQSSPPITLPLEDKETLPKFKIPPSEEEIWRAYPMLANLMHLTGAVKVTCDVAPDATVDHCVADTENPTGLGFAAAALHIASGFNMNPATIDGRPVKAKYSAMIRFNLPAADTVPAAPEQELAVSDAKLALASRMISVENFKTAATQTYEAGIERMNQELGWSGRPSETQEAMDAYRQGVQDALAVAIERRVRRAAARMSEADLTAVVTFLESPAGQTWLTLNTTADPDEAENFQTRVGEAARKRFCAKVHCI